MRKRPDPQAAIADYLAARSESGEEPPFRVYYERGWVRWDYGSGWPSQPKRVRELVEMTKRIRERRAA